VFDGNMASLPLLIYTELINPQPAGQMRVWGAALTLIIVVAFLMVLAAVATRLLTRKR
jgi:phosphate transport system permease protein